jgi:hypothetical protein
VKAAITAGGEFRPALRTLLFDGRAPNRKTGNPLFLARSTAPLHREATMDK